MIYYKISTESGQSGCPLIFDDCLIGIHIIGSELNQLNGGKLFD